MWNDNDIQVVDFFVLGIAFLLKKFYNDKKIKEVKMMKKQNYSTKGFLIVVLTCILCLCFTVSLIFTGQQNTAFADSAEISVENVLEESEEVLSYVDIFKVYYEQARNKLKDLGINDSFSFDDFCEGYYSHNYDIVTYTNFTIDYVNEHLDYFLSKDNGIMTLETDLSEDAYYILSKNDYTVTPASEFKKAPQYFAFRYTQIKKGDIISELRTTYYTGHTAIISDINKSSEYGSYIQTIEAVGSGVQYGYLDDSRMLDFGVIILRARTASLGQEASLGQCNTAVNFCIAQLGKPYSLNPLRLNLSIDSNEWYCSELIYAAFKYAGIDIGVKKDSSGNNQYLTMGCLPSDINDSYNTSRIIPINNFLEISVVGKSGNTWTIQVYNKSNDTVLCEFNNKMCYYDDAENWTGLKNIDKISIAPYKFVRVEVKENWFATSVAFSYVKNGRRLITYGDRLNKDDCSLVYYINMI